jgi:hypothetical protein
MNRRRMLAIKREIARKSHASSMAVAGKIKGPMA